MYRPSNWPKSLAPTIHDQTRGLRCQRTRPLSRRLLDSRSLQCGRHLRHALGRRLRRCPSRDNRRRILRDLRPHRLRGGSWRGGYWLNRNGGRGCDDDQRRPCDRGAHDNGRNGCRCCLLCCRRRGGCVHTRGLCRCCGCLLALDEGRLFVGAGGEADLAGGTAAGRSVAVFEVAHRGVGTAEGVEAGVAVAGRV